MRVRPATPADKDAFYEICLRTGDAGADGRHLFDDPCLIGEVYVGPYLAMDTAIAFSVEDELGTVGYVLGTADTLAFLDECERRWWPPLRERYGEPGPDVTGADAEVARLIHHPPVPPPEVVAAYPAHAHIDFLPRGRGRGLGRLAMDHIVARLAEEGASGVHLDVAPTNERAIGFYRHLGFSVLDTPGDGLLMGRRLDRPST